MSLSGRSAVNQYSGEHTAAAIAHHPTVSSAPRRRNRTNSSGISTAPAIALNALNARGSGVASDAALTTTVAALPSAMKTGYPGGCGWCRATSKSRTPSAKFTESTSSRVGGRKNRCDRRNRTASAASPFRTRSDGPEPEGVVQAAETVTAQIHDDVLISQRPELPVDGVGDVG